MVLTKLYDPANGVMQVAGFMSGSGTNLKNILETEKFLAYTMRTSPFHVAVIFTDNPKSKAQEIGGRYNIPVITHDIREFYASRGKPLKDLDVRREFDRETVEALASYNISVGAFAGYMSIITPPLINAFLGINVHPADLTILDGDDPIKRKFTGGHAVRDAMLAGEKELRSTTHILEERVDYGKILMVSKPVKVRLPAGWDPKNKELVERVAAEHQNILKEEGDWIIFPKTLQLMAEGRYALDKTGALYLDGKLMPNGLRLDEKY